MSEFENVSCSISAESSLAEIRQILLSPERAATLSANDLVVASEVAHALGDTALAVRAMQILVEKEPEVRWHHRLALFHAQSSDSQAAEYECEKAIAIDPAFSDGYQFLSHIRSARGDFEGALAACRAQQRHCGENVALSLAIAGLLYQARRLDEALAAVREINDVGPPTEASLLLEAEIAQQLAMPHAGTSAAERAHRLWPDSANASATLARLLCHLAQYQLAIPVLRRACRLSPNDASIRYLLAVALTATSELDQALNSVLEALEIEPGEYEYLYMAASLCDRLGDHDRALSYMRQAIAAAPDHAHLHVTLAHMLSRAADTRGAMAALSAAERLMPEDKSLRDLRLYWLAQEPTHYVSENTGASSGSPMPKARATRREVGLLWQFLGSLLVQSRVLWALVLREFRHRTAHSRFGMLSVFIPMALQIVTLGIVLSIFNDGRPPIGDHLFFFYATGVMPFYLFIHIIDHSQNQFLDNVSILQIPIIKRLDIVLAVAITELLIITAVVVVTFGVFSLMSYGPPSNNQIECVFAMLAVWLFAFGLGLICAVMTNLYRPWANGWLIVQRFLYIASGVFFIPLNMPDWIREPLSWNPLLQGIEWFRTGLFDRYEPPWLDKAYIVGIAFATTIAGLMLERALRRKMRTQ